ncbi:MAG TPA: efflux RND transporter permease subunit [Eubacteriales bacterium]|nr:efflux RND transporter permease subunit [Eubacteriales bacterium]
MISKFSVKRPYTVFVAVILVIVLGVVAFTSMTPNLLPNIDLPYVVVFTSYVGATPEEVEDVVTKPIEQEMATLDNIDSISSQSSENYSMVLLQFTSDANMDAATMNIREKLDTLRDSWSDSVGTSSILNINPNMIPLAAVALERDGYSSTEMTQFYEETILPRLEGVEGVAGVSSSGLISEQVNVVLSQDKMDEMNVLIRAAVDGEFEDSETQLSDAQTEIDDGYEQVETGESKIKSGEAQLGSARSDLNEQIAASQEELDTQKAALESQRSQLVSAKSDFDSLDSAIAQLDVSISYLDTVISGLNTSIDAMEDGPEKDALIAQRDDYVSQRADLQSQRDALDTQRSDAWAAFTASSGISDAAGIDAAIAEIDAGLQQIEDGYVQLDETEQEARSQISSGWSQLKKGQEALDESREQLDDAQETLDENKQTLDDAKQQAYDSADLNNLLTLQSVGAILGAQNFSMPAGYVADDGNDSEWLVYVGDAFSSADELGDLILFDLGLDGLDPIRLSDVADIFVSDDAATTYGKINGSDAILFTLNKQSNYATATVSTNLHNEMNTLEEEYPGLSFSTLMDQGDYIRLVINSVLQNIVLGALLAVVILFLFLRDVRPTLIIFLSIPISVTFAIVLMYFSGVTMNIISMAGLAVGVGMLVDNSIVVIENTYRLRMNGMSAVKAAVTGAKQMAGAITASTLTTVCVFFPIVFVEGLTRQLFADMALTIAYSLLASLVVALTLVPALSSGLLGRERKKKRHDSQFLQRIYKKMLSGALRRKGTVLVLALLLLVVSAYAAINRGFIYFPDMDSPQMSVEITMPDDATFEEATAMTDEVASRVMQIPEVETCGSLLSSGLTSMFGISTDTEDTTQTMLYLVLEQQETLFGVIPIGEKVRDSSDLSSVIEDMCADLDCTVSAEGSGNMSEYLTELNGSGVTINLYGDDLDELQQTATEVAGVLANVEGTKNVSDGVENTMPALRITVDKEKAALEGLTTAQIYQSVALMLQSDASVTSIEDTDQDVVVSLPDADPTLSDLENYEITFQATDGTYKHVALKDVATFEESTTLQSITRDEQRRYVTVTAEIADGYNVTNVAGDAQDALAGYTAPDGVSIEFEGESETIMSALGDLGTMMLLGILIVYLIMVAQFQSLLSPFIVMMTIPLAFTGGLIALLICGMEISIVAMIGFIMLVGIIVNNGIVLIDTMNQLRTDGMERREAVVTAGTLRLRPVLMTALTTILGLLPLAFGLGIGGGLIQPVAVVSIGGLVYATFMTLFVVPILYDSMIKKRPRSVHDRDLEVEQAQQ